MIMIKPSALELVAESSEGRRMTSEQRGGTTAVEMIRARLAMYLIICRLFQ